MISKSRDSVWSAVASAPLFQSPEFTNATSILRPDL
jgi:hypothetical protein